jgi:hypothetical protein
LAGLIVVAAGVCSWRIVQAADRPSTVANPTKLADCQRVAAKDYKCYATFFANETYYHGTKSAFDQMKAAYKTDPYVVSECHQLAHIVGRTTYEKARSLNLAYQAGDNFCWSGFYHGAIEQAIAELGSAKIKSGAATICQGFADKQMYSFDHFNCVHGMGHGLMAVEGYNLFKSLDDCDTMHTPWERESCYGGIFMENVMIVARGDGTSAYLDPHRPLYPCTDVAGKYKQQCYLMQTSYVLQHNGYDFKKTFELCATADTGFVDTCYQSAGRDASGSTNSNVDQTVANCNKAREAAIDQDQAIRNCMFGADRDFVSYYHDNQQANRLCEAFGDNLVEQCKQDVTNYYSTF